MKDKSPAFTTAIDAVNLFNRVNYQGYIGALSSPFYGRAVASLPPRRLQLREIATGEFTTLADLKRELKL